MQQGAPGGGASGSMVAGLDRTGGIACLGRLSMQMAWWLVKLAMTACLSAEALWQLHPAHVLSTEGDATSNLQRGRSPAFVPVVMMS